MSSTIARRVFIKYAYLQQVRDIIMILVWMFILTGKEISLMMIMWSWNSIFSTSASEIYLAFVILLWFW